MIPLRLLVCISMPVLCLAANPAVVDFCAVQDTKNAPSEVYDFVSQVAALVPFNGQTFFVMETRAEIVRQRRAVAVLCAGNQNWILYDPDWMRASIARSHNELPRRLALAHEIAHHVAGDTSDQSAWDGGLWGSDKERIADTTAGMWLARLNVPEQDSLKAFDALNLPERGPDYPPLSERRKAVSEGYRAGISTTTMSRAALEKDLSLITDGVGTVTWEHGEDNNGSTKVQMKQHFLKLEACRLTFQVNRETTSTAWPNESTRLEFTVDLGQVELNKILGSRCCRDTMMLLWDDEADVQGGVSMKSAAGFKIVNVKSEYSNDNGGRESKQFQDEAVSLRYLSQDATQTALETLSRAKRYCATAH